LFWATLGLTLLAEALFPANPRQAMFGPNFWQDLGWLFYEPLLHAAILISYIYWLESLIKNHAPWLILSFIGDLPFWVRFIWGALLVDFLYWVQHYLNHKIPILWQFHAIHHSQKELSFFSDFRYHVFEYLIRHTILSLGMLSMHINVPTIAAYAIFRNWYSRFYHGNIRTSLGPLRYLLVTPQSHRIHHSIESRHRDLNFGSMFCIWDRLFRTQYHGHDEYPETGIEDPTFPLKGGTGFVGVLLTPLVQMMHPFRVLWLRWRGADPLPVPGREGEPGSGLGR
jgi:sterol desaturase/sphingolipid hydroxylase (fatty acid hydroxylase superfamily)